MEKVQITGTKEEEDILKIVSSVCINNSMSIMSISNKAIDGHLKLSGMISKISSRFDVEEDILDIITFEDNCKEEYYVWHMLNAFLRLSLKIDVSVLSNKFTMFRNKKNDRLLNDIAKLKKIMDYLSENYDVLRKMINEAYSDVIELDNKMEKLSQEIELNRKAMILVCFASKKYIEENDFDNFFISAVKRNIENINNRINGINSKLISEVTTVMSMSDLKRNISVHNHTIDKAVSAFIPAWMKIAEDIKETVKQKEYITEHKKKQKEKNLFSRVGQLVIDMKDVKEQ